jgi:pimeloyl-ACP methyl ester carboxylesterase
LADDIHALLESIGASPCVLGGLSMGGYVALAYARKYPTDLRGLALIDTRAEADTPEGKRGRETMAELARTKGAAAVADQMMPKMTAPDAPQARPGAVKRLRSIMDACPPTTIAHALLAMRDRPDYRGDLPSIQVPTLIVVGDADAITPPAMAEAMHKAIPGSILAVIKGAGHMAPMEQPAQVSQALWGFVEQVVGGEV